MRGLEVRAGVVEFVVLDDDQPGDGGEEGDVVQGAVRVGALFLLLRGVGWLEDEDGLDEEEEGGGVEELGGLVGGLRERGGRGLTGCAEKSIRSALKTEPQTIAANCHSVSMPSSPDHLPQPLSR